MATSVMWLTDFTEGTLVETCENVNRLKEPVCFILWLKKWKILLIEKKACSNIEAVTLIQYVVKLEEVSKIYIIF